MKIKMLESMAGRDFSLTAGDVTERFSRNEATRFIKAGIAEMAPPDPVKKPETKKEWEDEREKLLDENKRLTADADAAAVREAELQAQIAELKAFKAAVVGALGPSTPASETTEAIAAAEKRG